MTKFAKSKYKNIYIDKTVVKQKNKKIQLRGCHHLDPAASGVVWTLNPSHIETNMRLENLVIYSNKVPRFLYHQRYHLSCSNGGSYNFYQDIC